MDGEDEVFVRTKSEQNMETTMFLKFDDVIEVEAYELDY